MTRPLCLLFILLFSLPTSAEPKRLRNTLSAGPGLMLIGGRNFFSEPLNRSPVGTFSLEIRRTLFWMSEPVDTVHGGIEWATNATVHDWRTIRNAYANYDDPSRAALLGVSGLILGPAFGSNIASGLGVIMKSNSTPAFYANGGGQFAVFLRPSDPDIKFDIGFGVYVGGGIDVTRIFGLGLRMLWYPPAVYSLINNSKRHITTFSLTANVNF